MIATKLADIKLVSSEAILLNLGENLEKFCKHEVFNRGQYLKHFCTYKKINNIFVKFNHSLLKMPKIIEISYK